MNLLFVIALFIFWLVLSASLNPAHLIVGVLAAVLVVWISPKSDRNKRLSLLSVIAYGTWLFIKVMKSGIHVCKLILHPKLPIKPQMFEHKTELQSNEELTVLGNSITLTPGTITIEVEPGKLVVHALDEESKGDIESGVLERKAKGMFKTTKKETSN
ncbi:MAG: Na+/H+ antiporter subunit E [Kangiellaceae bacterium]|jgi:multicomponent Na+:H+ antiporter subunit E|nr:Na+/H+ antiporter subunit E [Kangiellaceae bacterium]